jgi:outer membrane protein
MKTMKNLMIAVVLFIGTTSLINAQSKTAHVDTQALVEAMPEMKAAQSQLEKLQKNI